MREIYDEDDRYVKDSATEFEGSATEFEITCTIYLL